MGKCCLTRAKACNSSPMRAVFLGFTFAFFIPDPCSAQCYCQYAMVGAHKSMLSPSEPSCSTSSSSQNPCYNMV